MPDSMLKHCGLSEYYVHYGWCLGFLVSNAIVFLLSMSVVWRGAGVICVTILKTERAAGYFWCVGEGFFQMYVFVINVILIKG